MSIVEKVAKKMCSVSDCDCTDDEMGCDPYCDKFQLEMLPAARAALRVVAEWTREKVETAEVGTPEWTHPIVLRRMADELEKEAKHG